MVQNKRAIMRRNISSKRNITTRSNRKRSRSPKPDNRSRNRGNRQESISTRNYNSRRNIKFETKSFAETKQKTTKNIRTSGGPPAVQRKRKLEISTNFTTQASKKLARERKFNNEPKKKDISTRSGKPDSKNKAQGQTLFSGAIDNVLKSKASPTKKKPEPVAVLEKPKPVVEIKSKMTAQKKEFVTMKRSPLREESSSEESESESESEEDPGLGPKLQVKADGALILVRNLPKEVTSRDLLLELFDQTPGIEQIAVHTDENGLSKGTADVAVSDLETARDVIAQNRSIAYRGHEIYMTLMGTSTITTTKQQVIAPMPKQHRTKKEKRKKKKRKESKKETKKSVPTSPPISPPATKTTTSPTKPKSQPKVKAKNLRMLTPNCVDPNSRPWNWGTTKPQRREYTEEYVPADWDEPDDTYYHVTMKKELKDHLSDM